MPFNVRFSTERQFDDRELLNLTPNALKALALANGCEKVKEAEVKLNGKAITGDQPLIEFVNDIDPHLHSIEVIQHVTDSKTFVLQIMAADSSVFALEAAWSDTIGDLKDRIHLTYGQSRRSQVLLCGNRQLRDYEKLCDVIASSLERLRLVPTESSYFHVNIELPTGVTWTNVLVNNLDTAYDLKTMIDNKARLPIHALALIYGSEALGEGRCLALYGLGEGITLKAELASKDRAQAIAMFVHNKSIKYAVPRKPLPG